MTENCLNSEILIYLPDIQEFMSISEGTGDNLLNEDRDEGYVDYININTYFYSGDIDVPFGEIDGGIMLLKKPYKEAFATNPEVISECMLYQYDKRMPYVIIEQKDN